MSNRDFKTLLQDKWTAGKFLCVGLDPDIEKIPGSLKKGNVGETLLAFNRSIIDATQDIVCAFKPNSAFYEAHGAEGFQILQQTISYIRGIAPGVPVILDAKRADIGNTNAGYVASAFDYLGADAITVHPYLGREAVEPFLDRKDKGVFVLCRTSNPGAGELQDLSINGVPLYRHVAQKVASEWNNNGNCGLVVGATYPTEMREIREGARELPFLIPGVGSQNGDLQKSIECGKDSEGKGFVLSVSRAIIYADDAQSKAQEFDRAIREALIK